MFCGITKNIIDADMVLSENYVYLQSINILRGNMIISQWKGVQYAIFKQSQIRGFTNPKSGIYKPEVGDLQAQSRGFTMVKLHKTSSNGDIHLRFKGKNYTKPHNLKITSTNPLNSGFLLRETYEFDGPLF